MDAAILQTLARIRNKEGVYSGENILQKALKDAEEKAAARGLTKLQAKKEEKVRDESSFMLTVAIPAQGPAPRQPPCWRAARV